MKKVLAIINPISGTGSKKNIPDLLGQAYNASEYELFLTYTKAAGHAEELARRAASEGYDPLYPSRGRQDSRQVHGHRQAFGSACPLRPRLLTHHHRLPYGQHT